MRPYESDMRYNTRVYNIAHKVNHKARLARELPRKTQRNEDVFPIKLKPDVLHLYPPVLEINKTRLCNHYPLGKRSSCIPSGFEIRTISKFSLVVYNEVKPFSCEFISTVIYETNDIYEITNNITKGKVRWNMKMLHFNNKPLSKGFGYDYIEIMQRGKSTPIFTKQTT